jgi:thiol-disulfide isomerase/thioredoxin
LFSRPRHHPLLCSSKQVISPIFETFAGKYTNVQYYKVDVDEQSDISQEVGIRAVRLFFYFIMRVCGSDFLPMRMTQMPTFVAFKNGEKIDELVGANPGGLEVRHGVPFALSPTIADSSFADLDCKV